MKSLRNLTILYFTQYSNFWGEIGFSKGGNITIPGKVTTVCLCVCVLYSIM